MKHIIKYGLALGTLSVSALVSATPVVLINTFSVEPAHEAATLAYWESTRDVLEQQPGYLSTKLHRSLSSDATYRFINVAEWESKKQFHDAIQAMRKELPPLKIEGVSADPNLYEIVRD
ncbi:antibiotic biosynthesis monooxygenase family protein [Vibrio crassostreae]|uniref:antibiotic biosynthesis monooxygenase family protein n=1 Tax=Vibrio crassostreae TaxID=246167 RepID=UPI0010458834|nr:antibiotic biosynthesis monooxygenase family protein [Vibrio crassostreae]TCW19268.1 antibiotic biosynthesis monooxygenase [Vibrio crassostreae]